MSASATQGGHKYQEYLVLANIQRQEIWGDSCCIYYGWYDQHSYSRCGFKFQ